VPREEIRDRSPLLCNDGCPFRGTNRDALGRTSRPSIVDDMGGGENNMNKQPWHIQSEPALLPVNFNFDLMPTQALTLPIRHRKRTNHPSSTLHASPAKHSHSHNLLVEQHAALYSLSLSTNAMGSGTGINSLQTSHCLPSSPPIQSTLYHHALALPSYRS